MQQPAQERPAIEPLYVFALLTVMLLWLQGERSDPHPTVSNRRHVKTAWDTPSIFSPTRAVSSTVYFRPDFVSPSTTILSKESFLTILLPAYVINENARISPLAPHRFYLEKLDTPNISEVYLASRLSAGALTTVEVISIAADSLLHKTMYLPGCNNNQTSTHGICYIALLRLPLEYCLNTSRFGCFFTRFGWSAEKVCERNGLCDKSPSWTCQTGKSSASFGFDDVTNTRSEASSKFCNELISSASLDGIYEYAHTRVPKNAAGKAVNNALCIYSNSDRKELLAGKIISFCGNVLYHSIAVDAFHHRVTFLQALFHNVTLLPDEYGENIGSKLYTGSGGIFTSAGVFQKLMKELEKLQPSRYLIDVPTQLAEPASKNNLSNEIPTGSAATEHAADVADLRNNTGMLHSCIFSVELLHHNDATQCIRLPRPSNVVSLPMHLYFDEKSSKMVVFYFDKVNRLFLSVLDSLTLELTYSIRMNDVHSGWFVPLPDSNDGAVMIIGDELPAGRVLNAIYLGTEKYQTVRLYQ